MAIVVPDFIRNDPFYQGWVDFWVIFGVDEGDSQEVAMWVAVGAFAGPVELGFGAGQAIRWVNWRLIQGTRIGRLLSSKEGIIGVGPETFLPGGAAGVGGAASGWGRVLSGLVTAGGGAFTGFWYILGGPGKLNTTESDGSANAVDDRINFQASRAGLIQVESGNGHTDP